MCACYQNGGRFFAFLEVSVKIINNNKDKDYYIR